ncbi:MAG: carbonic anhydrase [Chitinophagia bacterium]|jgi:carbonic anhydrase|nr:carbonic anhydrase [Chitinophagia bacterium]
MPAHSLQLLKEGNFRFLNNLKKNRDHLEVLNQLKDNQSPFAAIVSCMDSRTAAELIFDQGFGDIFSIRIAGNVVTNGILGSLEYATSVVGSKLIVVLGHTNCGAIKGACNHIHLGHLTELIEKIEPAVAEVAKTINQEKDYELFEYEVTKANVLIGAKEITERSSIINDLVQAGKVGVVPAIYNLATGKVHFL